MANELYDAIVVGARCAGSPTAMLLARKGYRVLVVDRATFPSDTQSTHIVHPPGVAALALCAVDRIATSAVPRAAGWSSATTFTHTSTAPVVRFTPTSGSVRSGSTSSAAIIASTWRPCTSGA